METGTKMTEGHFRGQVSSRWVFSVRACAPAPVYTHMLILIYVMPRAGGHLGNAESSENQQEFKAMGQLHHGNPTPAKRAHWQVKPESCH